MYSENIIYINTLLKYATYYDITIQYNKPAIVT